MTSPRGGDFYLATSGDRNLAVDIGVVNYVIAARSSLLNFMIADTDACFFQHADRNL